jgi:hypothetical protein
MEKFLVLVSLVMIACGGNPTQPGPMPNGPSADGTPDLGRMDPNQTSPDLGHSLSTDLLPSPDTTTPDLGPSPVGPGPSPMAPSPSPSPDPGPTNDPCAGVICNKPPANSCDDATTLRMYELTGSCENGTCIYRAVTGTCDFGCANGGCKVDPCYQVACWSPPANTCLDANTLQKWSSTGTCNDGKCSYTSTTVSCPLGCADGSCKSCDAYWTYCPDSNSCNFLSDDINNCGGCGNVCPGRIGVDPYCSSGRCELSIKSYARSSCHDVCAASGLSCDYGGGLAIYSDQPYPDYEGCDGVPDASYNGYDYFVEIDCLCY